MAGDECSSSMSVGSRLVDGSSREICSWYSLTCASLASNSAAAASTARSGVCTYVILDGELPNARLRD